MADKILKGAKLIDTPVKQATVFDLATGTRDTGLAGEPGARSSRSRMSGSRNANYSVECLRWVGI